MIDETTSLVLLANKGNYATLIYAFENIGFNRIEKEYEFTEPIEPIELISVVGSIKVDLIVGVFDDCDERIIAYFELIANKILRFDKKTSDAKAYNELFRQCTTDNICILRSNVYLQKNWLLELLFYNKNIANSGVVAITSSFLNAEYLPILSIEERFINVFMNADVSINDDEILFFKRQHLFLVGALDESNEIKGYEFLQFQIRAYHLGLVNYYIPSQTSIILQSKIIEESAIERVKDTIKEMRKNNSYYLPL